MTLFLETFADIGLGRFANTLRRHQREQRFFATCWRPVLLVVHSYRPPCCSFPHPCVLLLAATAHLHSPSHSPRYLLALLLLLIPTFLITLLAFLVDILLFVPHLEWGGWIVLASTILIAAAGVVICAMRRTLVSRKARKKRIAENAEMNGQNFYARQQAGARAESPPPMHQSAAPTANGALGSDRLPAFTTFEKRPDVTDEERLPLNARTPSNRTVPTSAPNTGFSEEGYERYNGTGRGGYEGMRGGRGIGNSGPRDEYGNPLPPSNAFGPIPPGAVRRDQSEPPMRHQYSNETVNSQGSRGRGRGGYPPRGFGRGGPYRGGRGGPGFDSYGRGGPVDGPPPGYGNGSPFPPMARGVNRGPTGYGREQSAPGYGRRPSPGPPSAPGGYGRQPSPGPPSAPGSYGRQPSPGPPSAPGCYGRQTSPGPPSAPGGYGRQQSPGPPSAPGGYARRPSPGPPSASGGYAAYGSRGISPGPQESQPNRRSESPPPPLPIQHPSIGPIGQAVEMDAYTGSPQRSPTFHQPMLLRDSDSDVQGLVGLQQGQKHRESPLSLTSVYSSQE